VLGAVAAHRRGGDRGIRGVMVESHLLGGRQDSGVGPLTYGQSITDACLDFDATRSALLWLADAVG
jgi:3-deoxy-7-phosphoheptulonate synthase